MLFQGCDACLNKPPPAALEALALGSSPSAQAWGQPQRPGAGVLLQDGDACLNKVRDMGKRTSQEVRE